jgi:hypothetical protein
LLVFVTVLLAGIGGLLMAAARTGPKDATSNLSEWIAWMNITPPKWLTAPAADVWGKRLAALFLIAAAITFSAWVYGYAQTDQQKQPVAKCSNVVGGSNSGPMTNNCQ